MGMKAPFPWFGGKSRVADLVWRELGADVPCYAEPFAGSLAVLLARPGGAGKVETVNDIDGLLANFWRALAWAPDAVAHHADWPIHEADLHARAKWCRENRESLTERLRADPEWHDARAAGWWVWGQSTAIAGNWPTTPVAAPHRGPRLGVNRGWDAPSISARLRGARVLCGDWSRTVSSETSLGLCWHSHCGVFLDPPYGGTRDAGCYGVTDDTAVHIEVLEWCKEHGSDTRLRIALCGYEGEHDALEGMGWRVVSWKTQGGIGNMADGRGRANSTRERIWFSPGCLGSGQMEMFT